MAASDQTIAAPNWSQTRPWTEAERRPFRMIEGASEPALNGSWISDDVRELLQSCLQNAWVYVGVITLLLSAAVTELRSYCFPLGLFLLSVGVFKGALSLSGRLREEITEALTTSPYDAAVEELVRSMLSKFDAKERAVLRALMVCEPWNRWRHLPKIGIPLCEQFEIIYKALDVRLIVQANSDEEFVHYLPQYLEPAKAMLFSPELRRVR